jgi:hypothetical protein
MTTTTVDELAGGSSRRALRAAAVVYVAAWLLGLATAPSAPSSDATDAAIQSFYSANGSAALLQATLVHGIAGVALAVFVASLARHLRTSGSDRDKLVMAAGLGAATVSLVQYAMELGLNRAAEDRHMSTSATLFHAVNVADALKLVLLAGAITAASRLAANARAFPRWVRGLGHATAPILVLGGAAFIVTSDALSALLALSLLLLLLWVGAAAVTVASRRPSPGPSLRPTVLIDQVLEADGFAVPHRPQVDEGHVHGRAGL